MEASSSRFFRSTLPVECSNGSAPCPSVSWVMTENDHEGSTPPSFLRTRLIFLVMVWPMGDFMSKSLTVGTYLVAEVSPSRNREARATTSK